MAIPMGQNGWKTDIFQALKSINGRNHELCYADRFAAYIKLDIMTESLPYHEEVLGLLDDLASLNPRVGPNELVALWFDALYFPAQSYVNSEGQAAWAACFTSSELTALAKFNVLFDGLVDELPMGSGWENCDAWLKVSAAAAAVLKEIANDV